MTLLPGYADELARAGDRQAQHRATARRRVRLLVLAVCGLIAVAAVAAAATTIWDPQLGDDHRGHPVRSGSAPPDDQLAHLGVLRREPADADHGEQVRYALSMFSPGETPGIHTDYVRLLGTHGHGLGDVLVPATIGMGKPDALCLFMRDPVDGGGVGCFTTADVLAGHAVLTMIAPPSPSEPSAPWIPGPNGSGLWRRAPIGPTSLVTFTGLVPDGVAKVRAGNDTAAVKDNFFTITRRGMPDAPMTGLEWFDDDGQAIAH